MSERITPDAIAAITNLTPETLSYIQDDPDSPDSNWLVGTDSNKDTELRLTFDAPSGDLEEGADLQEFRLWVRKTPGQTGTPTITVKLYENGGEVATLINAQNVTSDSGEIVSATWNANLLSGISGANVEVYIFGDAAGGAPGAKCTVDIGAVEWNAALESPVITPSPAASPAATVDPTVVLGSTSVSPGHSASEADTVDPTVIKGSISLTPAEAASEATTVSPAVQLGSTSASPSQATAEAGTADPTVIKGSITLTPTQATSEGDTVAPEVVLGSTATTPAPAVSMAATLLGACLGGGIEVAPSPATSNATTQGPSAVNIDLPLTPAPATADADSALCGCILVTETGGEIDIGPGAIDRSGGGLQDYTVIDTDNPANTTGTLVAMELWALTALSDAKCGTFYGSGTSYTNRDGESLGSVSSGSKQTFSGLDCDVSSGDFLGLYNSSGLIEHDSGTGTDAYYKQYDQFGAGQQTYTLASGWELSIFAYGYAGVEVNICYIFPEAPAPTLAATVDPTVTGGAEEVEPSPAVAEAAAVDPSVIKGPITIAPSASEAEAESVAPSVSLGSTTAAPTAQAANAATSGPTVVKGSLSISPAEATAQPETVAPSVVLGSVTVAPAEASAKAATVDPTVICGPITVQPAEAMAEAASVDPSVEIGNILVTPEASAAEADQVEPTVHLGDTTATPAAQAAEAATQNPAVGLSSVTVSPAAQAAEAVSVAPSVVKGSLTVSPATSAARAATAGPSVHQSSTTASPGPAEAKAETVDPTIQEGALSIEPSAAPAEAASAAPGVILGSLTVSPSALAAVAATVDPSVQLSGVTVSPAEAAALAATLGPTVVLGGQVVTPAAAVAEVTIVNPTVDIADPPKFPTMLIRIALASDPLDATPSWTDISDDFIYAHISRGRQHELDRIEAATATMLLNNDHGNYYPDNAGGDYYPNIKTKKRINIRASYRGTTYDLFTGFVEAWRPDWLGEGGLGAIVRIEAAGISKHLANLLLNDGTGYSEEKSGTRVGNVLDDLGWPAGARDLDTGQSDMQATGAIENQNAMEHLQKVQESEAGIVFMAGDGTVTFQDRHARLKTPLNASQATFGADGLKIRDVDFSRDDSFVYNDIHIERIGGTYQTASDAASQTAHVPISLSRTGLYLTADTEAQAQADYLLSQYKDDHTRVKSITILPQAQLASLYPKVLGYDISTRITVKKTAAGIDSEYHIEGIQHTINRKELTWETKWQLSDADSKAYWAIGVAGFSEIGETTRVAY